MHSKRNPFTWEPTPEEAFIGQILALSDRVPLITDATFVHGAPVRDIEINRSILSAVAKRYHNNETKQIVINGLTVEESNRNNHGYIGFENWRQILFDYGVPGRAILSIPSSPNVPAESNKFLAMAHVNRWLDVTITSISDHQLRCMQQIVALMSEPYSIKVFNRHAGGIGLRQRVVRPVMHGSTVHGHKDFEGPYEEHAKPEWHRVVAYAQEPTADEPFVRHATIPKVLEYARWRDMFS